MRATEPSATRTCSRSEQAESGRCWLLARLPCRYAKRAPARLSTATASAVTASGDSSVARVSQIGPLTRPIRRAARRTGQQSLRRGSHRRRGDDIARKKPRSSGPAATAAVTRRYRGEHPRRAISAAMRGCWCVAERNEASAELVILSVLSAGCGGPLMHACRCGLARSAQ